MVVLVVIVVVVVVVVVVVLVVEFVAHQLKPDYCAGESSLETQTQRQSLLS